MMVNEAINGAGWGGGRRGGRRAGSGRAALAFPRAFRRRAKFVTVSRSSSDLPSWIPLSSPGPTAAIAFQHVINAARGKSAAKLRYLGDPVSSVLREASTAYFQLRLPPLRVNPLPIMALHLRKGRRNDQDWKLFHHHQFLDRADLILGRPKVAPDVLPQNRRRALPSLRSPVQLCVTEAMEHPTMLESLLSLLGQWSLRMSKFSSST